MEIDKIKSLIAEAQEEGLLCPTLYHYYKDGKDQGVNWIKIKQACKTLKQIKKIIEKS